MFFIRTYENIEKGKKLRTFYFSLLIIKHKEIDNKVENDGRFLNVQCSYKNISHFMIDCNY